jgi:class 3 adenylate cyclase
VRAAATAIDAAVAEEHWDQLRLTRLLPAQVEISIAAGEIARARAATEQLSGLAETYDSVVVRAATRDAVGRVLLVEGDPAAAAAELRAGVKLWREVAAPYEIARSRALLASALRAVGDDDDAELELTAAKQEFERLGAAPDALKVEAVLREAAERRAAPAGTRRTFMFTDIVGSTKLAEALGDASWEQLLRWHDDALRRLFGRFGGEEVNSTGDGFFVAFESATRAVECAIAIQRALADHRRASGFAIPVRIGLHTADANRRGSDYSGVGVHVAARVAGLAGGGEIVATTDALLDAGGLRATDARQAELRGISTPIEVATVPWA